MRFVLACVAVLATLLPAAPARALDFETCTKVEMERIHAAVDGALTMSAAAAAAVGDDETYGRWFGRYSARNAEEVRNSLKAVHDALLRDELYLICMNDGFDGCKDGTYAYVYRDEPYRIYLCPSFHFLPGMFEYDNTADEMENGTREGTIIHELSHFEAVAGTDDNCYARSVCSSEARRQPGLVIRNADSFQYYAEDIAVLPVPGGAILIRTGRLRR
ncbi:M35 family metallo-endopeptidase [Wenxinia marina]|uniref:Lysine-specific metallo-endopeptidase domain-containing protein n=1 Tax=Wenxinia marina DSM 24838 TaxID=1123501 RepID=A0A0D0QEW5_9RHOB|nr:M35 family metallo-endopeptidase [Wenxinia marina]KIQ69533.1 hypothetical protein Wenmar_01896 [Wenxinia marina DSM 24838]GGL59147.1 hypothetical protein GCM10011392_12020 [Wenxinia marina]